MNPIARSKFKAQVSRWGRGCREFNVTIEGELREVIDVICILGNLSMDMYWFEDPQSSDTTTKEVDA
jgi:hypothetical protein